MDTVAYPNFRWKLAARRDIEGYPSSLEHIGHHILKRRLDLGIQQKEAATRLGTNPWTLRNWETGRRQIAVRFYPAIIAFLGFNPLPRPTTQAGQVAYSRLTRGWSRKRLATIAGVDEATVRRIEADVQHVAGRPLRLVLRFLEMDQLPDRGSCWLGTRFV